MKTNKYLNLLPQRAEKYIKGPYPPPTKPTKPNKNIPDGGFVSFVRGGVPPFEYFQNPGNSVEERRVAVNFRTFELILDLPKAGKKLEYYNQNGSLKVTGYLSDIERQRIVSNLEAIGRILSGSWSIEPGPASMPEWIIATRLDESEAVLCWVRGCDQEVDAWVPEYRQLTGGLYLWEERIDGQAWRTRKINPLWTTIRTGDSIFLYNDIGQLIDSWQVECNECKQRTEVRQTPETQQQQSKYPEQLELF